MIETKDLELVVNEHVQGKLLTNAKHIRDFVAERVKDYSPEKYVGKVPEAKQDRATLNAAAKDLNSKRLDLERQFMEPFAEFKSVITETVNEIKTASSKIGDVIGEVEQRERDERLAEIRAAYDESGFTLVLLERILDQRWLNKSTSTKKWKEELSAAIEKINTDLESLSGIGEDEETVKAFYLDTLDIGRALQHERQLRERREALAEQKRKAQEVGAPQDAPDPEPEPTEAPAAAAPTEEAPKAEILSIDLRLHGTKDQLTALRQYIDESKIRYEKL